MLERSGMMANKTYIQALLQDTRKQIVQDSESWKSFLKTSSRLTKFFLTDQMLMHAQRPGLIAAAPYDLWGKVGCHVERGSKGIALLSEDNRRIHYVFDIADVAPNSANNKLPSIWEMTDDKKPYVISQLEKIYGETDNDLSDDDRLVELLGRAADEFINTRLAADQRSTAGQFFKDSVTVAMLYRCGIDPDTYWKDFDFSGLPEIMASEKSFEVFNIGIQETLRPFIDSVGKAVAKYDRMELVKEQAERERNESTDRVRNEEGRTTLSDSSEQGRDDGSHREVRTDEAPLSEGEPERAVSQSDGERRAAEALSGDGEQVRGNDERADREDDTGRESTGSSVSAESTGNEQYPAEGGRDSSERDNLSEPGTDNGTELRLNNSYINRVNELFPTSVASLDEKVRFISFLTDEVRKDEATVAQITNPTINKEAVLDAGRIAHIINKAVLEMPSAGYNNLPWTFTYRPQTNEIAGLIFDLIKEDTSIINPDISVADWYRNTYPGDIFSAAIAGVTFRDVINTLNKGEDFYALIGSGDSVVRENIFRKIESDFGITYNDIYNKWLSFEEKDLVFPGETAEIPVSREGNTVTIGANPTREITVEVSDEEYKAIENAVPETVTADDVEIIRYSTVRPKDSGHTREYEFLAEIKGERDELFYSITRHDGDEESFSIHTRNNDIYDRMIEPELRKLEERLYDEALIGEKLNSLNNAGTLAEIESIRLMVTEDEHFPTRLMSRFNVAYAEKEKIVQPRDISQDDIDTILCRGGNIQHGKFRIYDFFTEDHTAKEKADFLRDEYGIGGTSPAIRGVSSSEMHDAKGIRITLFEHEQLVKYNEAAKRIGELISEDKYLSEEEKAELNAYHDEIEKRDFEKEEDMWFKLYLTFNDDNELHADNSFHNNHYPNAKAIHDANVDTVKQTLNSTVSEEEINELVPGAYQYIEEAKAEITEQYKDPFAIDGNYFNLTDGTILYANSLADDEEYNIEYGILDNDGKIIDHDLVFVPEPVTADRVMDFISAHDSKIHFGGKAVYGVDLAGTEPEGFNAGDIQEIRELLLTSEYNITEAKPNIAETPEQETSVGEPTVAEEAKIPLKSVEPKTKGGKNVIPRNAVELDVVAKRDTMAMKQGEHGVIRKDEIDGWILTTESGKEYSEFISNIRSGFGYNITGMRVMDESLVPDGEEVTFTVAESSEFHNIGLYKQGIATIENAKALLDGIENRAWAPSIGIKLENTKDGETNEVQWDILIGNTIDLESLDRVPDIKNSPEAVSKIKEIISAFPEAEVIGTLPEVEEKTEEPFRESVAESTGQNEVQADSSVSEQPSNNAPLRAVVEQTAPVPSVIGNEEFTGNYHILDDNLGVGPVRQKFYDNIAAITVLKQLEAEDRPATLQEQQILSHYVGWGGLADAFDEGKASWSTEYNQLKEILTDAEYKAARSSTLNAHYTSPIIIREMYQKLIDMGITSGNILEPAMGTGNFFGMMPDSMRDSSLYGVELDPITGRIAQKLYPDADITISGFEKTHYPDNVFDVAIGNVPFGEYSVNDPDFTEKGFLIHDYFFAKALDKVKPGGVVAFITSSGTMDKKSTHVREYLARRADLIGAVRLPNTAFKANAGTEVTADIIFLQKRATLNNDRPAWVDLGETDDGIPVNNYFADRPDMILGTMKEVSGRFGTTVTCEPDKTRSLEEQLRSALSRIDGSVDAIDTDIFDPANITSGVEEDGVPNYTFFMKDDQLYFKNGEGVSEESDLTGMRLERVKGLIPIRDSIKNLLAMQLDPAVSDISINMARKQLNTLYDNYVAKYGHINSRGNDLAFRSDASYPLICSLEIFDDDGEFERKADIFTQRTVEPVKTVEHADNAVDALAVCLNNLGRVDIPYIAQLTGFSEGRVITDLENLIYKDPATENYVTADEYLSGDIREKVRVAQEHVDNGQTEYGINVEKLNEVMPPWLGAQDISISLGATWYPIEMVQQFMEDTFNTPETMRGSIRVEYSGYNGAWNITESRRDQSAIATATYGTSRKTAYELLEATLNSKNVKVYDSDSHGNRVINRNETMLAQQKQQAIKEAFHIWTYSDPDRRRTFEELYNNKFNSIRPRQYDGSHLTFPGMSSAIELKPHQKDAVAHILYGGSTLLAHVVGAGKTFEMAAGAMESKRLGFCNKSLVVVPDHLTEQEGGDFARLYPGANILVAQKKDFETKNRKQFCSRIATGNYDVIIMGHSQFNKIPLSKERQIVDLQLQVGEIVNALNDVPANEKKSFSVKQMEKTKKNLEAKIEGLNKIKQDNVITFEELGVDKLFIDESHYFKNLYTYTKMSNVAGVQTTDSQKAADMYSKTRYINEITGGKGVVFATGTPVANSMTELFTNMRYLMPQKLQENGFSLFDSWASVFGEIVTAVELAPEGNKFRQKSRFAKFHNVPELISMFKECADIKTADMLNLDVPEAEYVDVTLDPSPEQEAIVKALGERAERVRNGGVQSTEDNMLKITSDGRKAALDQRLFDPSLGDDPNSKVNACADNVFEIWKDTAEQKSAQMIFCDLSTPKAKDKNDKDYQEWESKYDVYNDIKQKLMDKGIPADEIAFVHDADDDKKKAALFAKVRAGKVRVLIGSTQKMGAGTNVQKRLIALHHMDAPWRPADIEQREGRIIRQGNSNPKVKIFRYLKTGTFDAYMWQTLRNKQRYISQIMTSKTPDRSCDELDYLTLSYAEVTAQCAGDPLIKEKIELENEIQQLNVGKSAHLANKFRLQDDISINLPGLIKRYEILIDTNTKDIATYAVEREKAAANAQKRAEDRAKAERGAKNKKATEKGKEPDNSPLEVNIKSSDYFTIEINGKTYTEPSDVQEILHKEIAALPFGDKSDYKIGSFMGFELYLSRGYGEGVYNISAKGEGRHSVQFSSVSSVTRVINALSKELSEMGVKTENAKQSLENAKRNLETAKNEVEKPFEHEQELADKIARLAEVDAKLGVGADQNEGNDLMDEEPETEKTVTDYAKIGKSKDGTFSVNVKPYEIIFEMEGITKSDKGYETKEEAEKALEEVNKKIEEALNRDAEPETVEKMKEDIVKVRGVMDARNRRSMPHDLVEFMLNKTYDMIDTLKNDPVTADIAEGLKAKLSEDKTFGEYEKKEGVWYHRKYALGTPECRDAEKNSYSYYNSDSYYHNLNTGTFNRAVDTLLADAVASAVDKNPEVYKGRDDLLTVYAQYKFEDFRKDLQDGELSKNVNFLSYNTTRYMTKGYIELEVKDGKMRFKPDGEYGLNSKIFGIKPIEYEADLSKMTVNEAIEGLNKHVEELAHIEAVCSGSLKDTPENIVAEVQGIMPYAEATLREAIEDPDKYSESDRKDIDNCMTELAEAIMDFRYNYRMENEELKKAVSEIRDSLENDEGRTKHPILTKYKYRDITTETLKSELEDMVMIMGAVDKVLNPESVVEPTVEKYTGAIGLIHEALENSKIPKDANVTITTTAGEPIEITVEGLLENMNKASEHNFILEPIWHDSMGREKTSTLSLNDIRDIKVENTVLYSKMAFNTGNELEKAGATR